MFRIVCLLCFLLVLSSCDIFFSTDDSEIGNLRFTRSERHLEPYKAFSAGSPLVLSAIADSDHFRKPAQVNVYSSSGQFTRVSLRTLHNIPGEQFAAIIEDHGGWAMVTVKEADRKHALDRNTSLYTTSPQTLQKIRNWIDNMEGVDVESQIINSPVLVLHMTPTADIVNTIRNSDNVEILEPDYRIILFGGSGAASTNAAVEKAFTAQQMVQSTRQELISVMGVIFTTTDESSNQFHVQPGDTITAKYDHPDGSVLTTRTTIK